MNGSILSSLGLSVTLSLLHVLWIGSAIAVVDTLVAWCLQAPARGRYLVHVSALALVAVSFPVTLAVVASRASEPLALSAERRLADVPAVSSGDGNTGERSQRLVPLPTAEVSVPAVTSTVSAPPAEVSASLESVAPYVAVAYLLGVLVMLMRLSMALWSSRMLRLSGRPADADVFAMARRQAQRIGLRLSPLVVWCERVTVPVVVGILKPTLLLPASLATGFDPRQLELLLAHELAHVRRFDLWINLFQRLVEAALFFHPAVWYLSRRVSEERENACDDVVLSAGAGRVQYAEALMRMAELSFAARSVPFASQVIVAATGERPSQFKRRILRLLEAEGTPRPQFTGRGLIVALLVGGSLLLGLTTYRAVAQPAKPPVSDVKAGEGASHTKVPSASEKQVTEKVYPLLGEDASERIKQFPPAFSKEEAGIEVGIALISDRKSFQPGERVPLEFVIRNVSQKTLHVEQGFYTPDTPPSVIDSAGEPVKLETVRLSGAVRLYRNTLKPGESAVYQHFGIGLAESPDPRTFWYPFWKDPAPGKYHLTQRIRVGVREDGEASSTFILAETGDIAFEVALANPGAQPAEANSNAKLDPKVLVAVEILDAESGAPVKAFRVIPGVPYDSGTTRLAVWQAHLLKEATEGKFAWLAERSYEDFQLRFEAEGYIPGFSPWIKKADGQKSIVVKLKKDPQISGRVLQPDGKPAGKAVVAIALPNRSIRLVDGKVAGADAPLQEHPVDRWRRPLLFKADDQGRYRIPTEPGAAMVYAIHDSGIAEISPDALKKAPEIHLQEWCVLDGEVLWIDKPGANETLSLSMMRELHGYPEGISIFQSLTADGEGRFRSTKLPPWHVQISRSFQLAKGGGYLFPHLHVDLSGKKGEVPVVLGGKGRPVIGRLTGLKSYEGLTLSLTPVTPSPGFEAGYEGQALVRASNLGPVFYRNKLPVEGDGTFRIENVLPENYQLFVHRTVIVEKNLSLTVDGPDRQPIQVAREKKPMPGVAVQLIRKFDLPRGKPDEVFDLGELKLALPADKPATAPKAEAATLPEKAQPDKAQPEKKPIQHRVVDAQEKPIPGAKIEILPYELEPKSVLGAVNADDRGQFVYPPETPATGHYYVQVSATGFVTHRWIGNFQVSAGEVRAFALDRPVTISGRVLGAGGQPLAGVPLAFDFYNDNQAVINKSAFVSDSEGRFKLEGLSPGELFVRYTRRKKEGDPVPQPILFAVAHVTAKDGETHSDVTLDLSKAKCVLEGRVLDAQGKGVPEASIRISRAVSAQRLDHSVGSATDAEGRFRVEGLAPGNYSVHARSRRGALGDGTSVDVQLDKPAKVTLTGFSTGKRPPADRKVEPIWGETHNGLQSAVVLDPAKETYAPGDVISVQSLVRNVSDKTIEFTHSNSFSQVQVTLPDKQTVHFDYSHFTGLPWTEFYRLEPKHELVLKGSFPIGLQGKDQDAKATFRLPVESGKDYPLRISSGDNWPGNDAFEGKTRRLTGEVILRVK